MRIRIGDDKADNYPEELLVAEWEIPQGFTPPKTGEGQKVAFLLFKDDDSKPCLRLHFWVYVYTLKAVIGNYK